MKLRCLLVVLVGVMGLTSSSVQAVTPQVNVLMKVDKNKAARGDLLHYKVSVRNLTEESLAHVEMTSHIPSQTTGVTDQCPEGPVEPDGDICIAPNVPTPGLGESAHQVRMGFGPLARHATVVLRFTVRINDDATIGSKLPNHAHAQGDLGPEHPSNQVSTTVIEGA